MKLGGKKSHICGLKMMNTFYNIILYTNFFMAYPVLAGCGGGGGGLSLVLVYG